MFEGTTDVSHLEFANNLYTRQTDLTLLDTSFRVFAIGEGEEGGTDGMLERYRLLRDTLKIFPIDDPERRIRIICVLDDDPRGRGAFNKMSGKFAPWSDIFLLRRSYARVSREPGTFRSATDKLNETYLKDKSCFCEIEDLISRSLIDDFVSSNSRCLQKPIQSYGNGFHCDLNHWAKGKLVEHVKENAILDDVKLLVELLKSLRFLFDLPMNGSCSAFNDE
jgi:hypothetical protein